MLVDQKSFVCSAAYANRAEVPASRSIHDARILRIARIAARRKF